MRMQPLSAMAIAAGLALAAIAAVGCSGCAGTETGNPFQVELRADAHSSDPGAVAVGEGGAVVVTEAWLALDPIGLAPSSDCDAAEPAGGAPDFGTADHAAAGAVLEEFELDEGDFCRAVLPFVRAAAPLPEGAPPELEGSSVFIAGELTATGTPFRLVSTLERSIDVRAVADGFALGPDEPALFLGFDVATWFAAVDLAGAELDGEGVAVIDAGSNPELLSAFESDLAAGIELYRDLDRDGSVDAPDDELLARGQ
jgi:hypothetical protein